MHRAAHSARRSAESGAPQSSEHQAFHHCPDTPNQDRWLVKFAASLQEADGECLEIARRPGSRHIPSAGILAGAMTLPDCALGHSRYPQTVSLTGVEVDRRFL